MTYEDFTLKVNLDKRDFREKRLKYDDCQYGAFMRKLQKMYKLQSPLGKHYKIFYRLDGKLETFNKLKCLTKTRSTSCELPTKKSTTRLLRECTKWVPKIQVILFFYCYRLAFSHTYGNLYETGQYAETQNPQSVVSDKPYPSVNGSIYSEQHCYKTLFPSQALSCTKYTSNDKNVNVLTHLTLLSKNEQPKSTYWRLNSLILK